MRNEMTPSELERIVSLDPNNPVFIDTETTGLRPGQDEVLSIAIVDKDGNELFYSLIRPLKRKRWPNATNIHGITWNDVKMSPTILDVGNEVTDILGQADLIVGYNLDFDIKMLEENGLPSVDTKRFDLMEEYAHAYGRWSDRKNDFLWVKLAQCAKHYGYTFDAHNALEDAKATAYCFQKFKEECAGEIPAAEERYETFLKQRAKELEIERAEEQKREAINREIDTNYKIMIAVVSVVLILGGMIALVTAPFVFWFFFVLGIPVVAIVAIAKLARR